MAVSNTAVSTIVTIAKTKVTQYGRTYFSRRVNSFIQVVDCSFANPQRVQGYVSGKGSQNPQNSNRDTSYPCRQCY